MHAMYLTFFNDWLLAAKRDLADLPRYQSAFVRRDILTSAVTNVTRALRWANTMQDNDRKALCLRVLNWLRSDLRKVQP